MSSATAGKAEGRERIQSAAKDLFYRQGIRATGVEEVCRVAEATKMSLYRAYPSKDALVAAILCEDAAAYDAWFEEVTASAPTPAGQAARRWWRRSRRSWRSPELPRLPDAAGAGGVPRPRAPDASAGGRAQDPRCATPSRACAKEAGAAEPETARRRPGHAVDGAWSAMPYMGGARAAEVLRRTTEAVLREALP